MNDNIVAKNRFLDGLKSASLLFAINAAMPIGSYLVGCTFYHLSKCSIRDGIFRTTHHFYFGSGLFIGQLAVFTVLGFFIGFLIDARPPEQRTITQSRFLIFIQILTVLAAIQLITAFALWGLPELPELLRSR